MILSNSEMWKFQIWLIYRGQKFNFGQNWIFKIVAFGILNYFINLKMLPQKMYQ